MENSEDIVIQFPIKNISIKDLKREIARLEVVQQKTFYYTELEIKALVEKIEELHKENQQLKQHLLDGFNHANS